MKILEYLYNKYPNSKLENVNTRIWNFDRLTESVAFQNDIIDQLHQTDHEELLTGVVNTGYYGFIFVKPGSHVSIKPTIFYKQDLVLISVTVQVMFQA